MKTLHSDMIDALIEGHAVPCLLEFSGTRFVSCINCIYSPATGKSSNKYLTGGPAPFSFGICPICHGAGKIEDPQTEPVQLAVLWNSKEWIVDVAVDTPDEYVQTLCEVSLLSTLKKANILTVNTDIIGYTQNRFERDNEPQPCGLGQSSHIWTMWKRIA
jgi:hypothetical protein